MLACILFAPLWGLLSDRLARRKPLIVAGFLLSSPLYAAYGAVESVGWLLALRFVQGAVTVAGWSTLMALVLDRVGERWRGRSLGLMGGAISLGISLGAPLGGYLSRDLGVRSPLLAASGLFLLVALGSLALPEAYRGRQQVPVGEIGRALARRPRLLLPYSFYFVDRYTVGLFVVLFPLYLGAQGVADPAVRGRYLACFLLPFALLQVATGRLAERTGPFPPLVVGSLAYGVLLTLVGVSDLGTLWWVMLGLGAAAAVMFPPTMILTAELSDPLSRGSAMGGFNLAGSLGFTVGPLAGAWAFEAGGYGFAFALAGGLEVAAALLALSGAGWLALARRRRGGENALPPGDPAA
jgi:MFS family permease